MPVGQAVWARYEPQHLIKTRGLPGTSARGLSFFLR